MSNQHEAYFCNINHKIEMVNGKIHIQRCKHILDSTTIDFIVDPVYKRSTKNEYLRALRVFECSSMCVDDVLKYKEKYLELLSPLIKDNKDKNKRLQFVNIARAIDKRRREKLEKMGYVV